MAKYHMRKQEREITDRQEIKRMLKRGKYAVLAMCRENEPYAVTLSYGYDECGNALYFHTGNKGLKMDFLRQNPYVCATILEDDGYRMGACKHAYHSLVLFGKMSIVESLEEKKYGMDVLLNHLEERPETIREGVYKDENVFSAVAVLRLDIIEITGKTGT